MQRISGWAAALSVFGLGACLGPEPFVQEAVQAAIGPQPPGGPCPEEGCGSNSPVIDVIGTHEFALDGTYNLEGFTIERLNKAPQIRKGADSYDLHVVNGVITGTRIGMPALAGQALVNAWIPIFNRHTRTHYALSIASQRTLNFFRGATASTSVDAYTLEWHAIGKDVTENVCNNVDGLIAEERRDSETAQRNRMGLTVWESVVFEGDRVDTALKTMQPQADDRWINIGCAGHTLAKLYMTRNTVHTQVTPLTRAWQQRQATLKLLAADYCGTGDVFTVAGQKLLWQGDQMTFFDAPGTLEARWNERGAICLLEPRMKNPSTPLGAATFPDIWRAIWGVCNPPRCFDTDPMRPLGADRVSANR